MPASTSYNVTDPPSTLASTRIRPPMDADNTTPARPYDATELANILVVPEDERLVKTSTDEKYEYYTYKTTTDDPVFMNCQSEYCLWIPDKPSHTTLCNIAVKVFRDYPLARTARNILILHQVVVYKTNKDREVEICKLFLAAAQQPGHFSQDWMIAMKVALLHKPIWPGAALYHVCMAMRVYNICARVSSVTARARLDELRSELLIKAFSCEVGDLMQLDRQRIVRLVGRSMRCEEEVEATISEANVILKSSLEALSRKRLEATYYEIEKFRASLFLGGYDDTLDLLEEHPIREATISEESRNTLSSLLSAGAELGWPSWIINILDTLLKACSADKPGFAKGIMARVDKIADRVMLSQASLSRVAVRDATNCIVFRGEYEDGKPPIALVRVSGVDDSRAGTNADTQDHEPSRSDTAVIDAKVAPQTPTDPKEKSNTANAQEPPAVLASTRFSSDRTAFASTSRVKVRLLGSWALLPEASLTADYARVQLVMRSRKGSAYKTVRLIKSPKRMRARNADHAARGSKPWRTSPLNGSANVAHHETVNDYETDDGETMAGDETVAGGEAVIGKETMTGDLTMADDEDADSEQTVDGDEMVQGGGGHIDLDVTDSSGQKPLPRSKPIAANPLLDQLYRRIWRIRSEAQESQKRCREHYLATGHELILENEG